jgi:hypothetical protein
MTELARFALCIFFSQGIQVSDSVPEGFPQLDEFVSYWSPVGFQITIESKGELMSELANHPGVRLEIKAKKSSNPNFDRLRPVVFSGSVSMRTQVDAGSPVVELLVPCSGGLRHQQACELSGIAVRIFSLLVINAPLLLLRLNPRNPG